MKSLTALFSILFVMAIVHAQNNMTVDTIFANEQKVVSLFFPDPIRQGITGSPNFAFSYNREKQQYFGLLQATPGEESNLLVITANGKVYSYILRYSRQLEKLHYIINPKNSIGEDKPYTYTNLTKTEKPVRNRKIDSLVKPEYVQHCSELLQSPRLYQRMKSKKKVAVHIVKNSYHGGQVYVMFEIVNPTQIDYEIDSLELYRVNGNNKRRASYQELPLSPVYKFKMPQMVPKGQQIQFVYVYPKFTLSKNERLVVKLEELNGARDSKGILEK